MFIIGNQEQFELHILNRIDFLLSMWNEEIHHRDTESTEIAQRVEYDSSLRASSVSSVSLW